MNQILFIPLEIFQKEFEKTTGHKVKVLGSVRFFRKKKLLKIKRIRQKILKIIALVLPELNLNVLNYLDFHFSCKEI